MNRRAILVSLLAAGLLAWFLRGVDLADVWSHVRAARPGWMVLAVALMVSTYWIRAWRWQQLLAPVGPARFRTVFRAGVVGFAALALLPARAGDLLRPYLLARQERLPVSAVVATIVVERILDLLAVLGLMALYVWVLARADALPAALLAPIRASAALGTLAVAAGMGLMWLLASHPERVGRLVLRGSQLLPRAFGGRLALAASRFSSGFAIMRAPWRLWLSVCWSIPLWVVIAAEAWAVSRSLGIEMPFAGAFLLQAMLVVGVAVPTPAGVGSFHEAYRLGVTTFFGAANDQAVAAAILVHAISYVPVVIAGTIFMLQDGLSLGRLEDLTAATGERAPADEVPVLRSPGR